MRGEDEEMGGGDEQDQNILFARMKFSRALFKEKDVINQYF